MRTISRTSKLSIAAFVMLSGAQANSINLFQGKAQLVSLVKSVATGTGLGGLAGLASTGGFWGTSAMGLFGGYVAYKNHDLKTEILENRVEILENRSEITTGHALTENNTLLLEQLQELADQTGLSLDEVRDIVNENYNVLEQLCEDQNITYDELLAQKLVIYDISKDVKNNQSLIKLGIEKNQENFEDVIDGQKKIRRPLLSDEGSELNAGYYTGYFNKDEKQEV